MDSNVIRLNLSTKIQYTLFNFFAPIAFVYVMICSLNLYNLVSSFIALVSIFVGLFCAFYNLLKYDKYLTIDPIYEEEFDVRYDFTKKEKTDNPTEGFYYDYYDLETITGDEEKDNEDINIHDGIECTLCGRENIKGIRYLCGICENYNLCQECETRFGVEHGHPLLKIRNPELTPLSFGYKINKK